jgi:anti-sigma factor RsiW
MSHVDEGTLHAYLDGELSASDRAAVDAHLAQCSTCRAALAEERALLERATALLGAARPAERPAPPLEQLRRESQRARRRRRIPLAWAASILLALGVGYYMRSPNVKTARQLGDRVAPVAAQSVTEPPAPAPTPTRAGPPPPEPRIAQRQKPSDRGAADEIARTRARADSVSRSALFVPQSEGSIAAKTAATPREPETALSVRAERDLRPSANIATAIDGRLATTRWPVIDRQAASSLLGAAPVGLPGLPIRALRRSPVGDGIVVVEQALDSTTVIQIFQRHAGPTLYDSAGAGLVGGVRAAERQDRMLARFVGTLRVEIAGPVSADSLNRLLEQVQTLPSLP